MKRIRILPLLRAGAPLVLISALVSCSVDSSEREPVGVASQPLTNTECSNLVVNVDRSLFVHDQATLSLGDFSLRRTLETIGQGGSTPETLLKELLVSNAVVDRPQPLSGLVLPLDFRNESTLNPAKLLDATNLQQHLRPIALVNRLDLAPANAAYCGEHRIVYGRHQNGVAGRFFLIFEAALPNPHPELGIEGCRPVADFWASLGDAALFPTPASRAAALEQFYYQGLPGFEPVVLHAHYGSPFGQIRSNQFVNSAKWQLRQWRAGFDAGGAPALLVQPDGQTPLAQFFDSQFVPGPGEFSDMQPGLFASERAAFQSDFLLNQIPLLAAPELAGTATSEFAIINGFGSNYPARFLEFQSDASDLDDVPSVKASTGFMSVVGAAAPMGLTGNDITNRVGTTECGGCHQFSNNNKIGKLANGTIVNWPSSAGFVHVTEDGTLSQALTQFFLPARAAVLRRALCPTQCAPMPHRKRCCFSDNHCAAGSYCAAETCSAGGEGRCKALVPAGQCWEDADCGDGGQCQGAILCPCGVDCVHADQPGQCASASFSAIALSKANLEREEKVTKPSMASIEAARAADRAQPGAFVPVRPTH
jgi:hypothetical protein